MRKPVDKTRCGGTLTEAGYSNFIKGGLRRMSYRWKPKNDALKTNKKGRNQYVCEQCKNIFGRKDIQVDHIIPVVAVTGFTNWDSYINRLFCEVNGLRILCKPCHKAITKEQNLIRKQNK